MNVPAEVITNLQPLGNLVGALLTFGIFSILWKENPVYRVCEHIFVGSTAAYTILTTFSNTIKPGIQSNMIEKGEWWEILPILLGCMIYFQPFKDLRWLSRFPMAFWIGYSAGLNLTMRTIMPLLTNVKSSMLPLVVFTNGSFDLSSTFNNIVFTLSITLTLLYFFFSFEKLSSYKWILSGARWVIMIAFGASFGNTVMSRISLFLGRLDFLLGTWLGII